MHKRVSYQSGKLAKRRRKIFIFRIILGAVFFISFIVGTAFWSHADGMNIQTVTVEGNTFSSADDLTVLTKTFLEGSHLFGYSRANFALFPRGEIRDAIIAQYSEIKSVDIDLRGLTALTVRVTEYAPVVRWCADSRGTNCYFVDERARLFLKEPLMNAYELFTVRGLIEGEPLGQTYVSEDFIKGLVKFNESLAELDLATVSVTTEDGETFNLTTEEGLVIYIDKSDDFEEIFDNLRTVVKQEAIHKAQFRNIEYIDLRFGNKVVYKLKEWN